MNLSVHVVVLATPKSRPCPEPMCANACPYGYAKNEAGCMTCTCDSIPSERVCGVSVETLLKVLHVYEIT